MSANTSRRDDRLQTHAQTTRGKQSLRLWLRLLACEGLVEQTVRTRLRNTFDITLPQFDVLSELEHATETSFMLASVESEKVPIKARGVWFGHSK